MDVRDAARPAFWSGALGLLAVVAVAACGDGAASGDGGDAASDADAGTGWGAGCEPRPGEVDDVLADGRQAFLDLEIHGVGFEAYDGHAVRLMTFAGFDPPLRVLAASEVRVDGGTFDVAWVRAYSRGNHQPLYFYLDVDRDGTCDPGRFGVPPTPAVDLVWAEESERHDPGDDEPYRWVITPEWNPAVDPEIVCDVYLDPCATP